MFILTCHAKLNYVCCAQRGQKKKYWSTNKNSCCATLNVEQKEATAELYILDANASCLPP